VTVVNGTVQVTLAWDPNTEPQLAGYKVYFGTSTGVYTTTIDVQNVTTYTVTGLAPGQTYYFAVTAYDGSGDESGFSNEVSAAK
jgi:fibronectin type 3 domain-containing protein